MHPNCLVKRAIRALLSPAYTKARSKNLLLPEVANDAQARAAIQLLPLSILALRVSKADPHEGHDHAKPKKDAKRIKGLWTVKIERQQEFEPMMHYVWLYEGPQWKNKVYAGLALVIVMAIVLFPLWPLFMRQGGVVSFCGCDGLCWACSSPWPFSGSYCSALLSLQCRLDCGCFRICSRTWGSLIASSQYGVGRRSVTDDPVRDCAYADMPLPDQEAKEEVQKGGASCLCHCHCLRVFSCQRNCY